MAVKGRQKTSKSAKKRVKVTGTGKVLRHRPSKRHLQSAKTAKRRRALRKQRVVSSTEDKRIKQILGLC